MSFRSRVEHASSPLVARLARLPRLVAFLGVLAVMVAGILVPRIGFVFTLLVAVLVAWLLFLGWPRLTPPERLGRIAVLFLIVAVALVQAFPR
ncbi:MAG: DUF6703 family protein [Dermatophilaceae bacterium]